jgi:acyl-CoA synthetase (AMP-forming)/AMP-acid ligase II
MRVGAVGEFEPAQPVIGCGKPEPGFGVAARLAGGLFDRAAEIALCEAEIAFAEMPLPQAEIVIGVLRRGGRRDCDRGIGRNRAGRLRRGRGRRREDPEATSRVLRPGPHPWEKLLHTGDLFRADEDGYLYFVGRRDDIIKSRGEKVSPKEVENVLYALPGVREAAVVGVPDPILGMAIKAILVVAPDAGLEAEDVIRHCGRHLEDFMVPKFFEFRDELPKTESGKISRRHLVAALAEAAP